MLTEINEISKKIRNKNKIEIKNVLKTSIGEEKLINIDTPYTDANGFVYGIFPQTIIHQTHTEISTELRLEAFNFLNEIFNENYKDSSFTKFSNSFYSFIVSFLIDTLTPILLICLEIINKMLATIPGINIIVNIHHSIPTLLTTLGNVNIEVRNKTKQIFDKIVMIIPTSQVLPYILENLNDLNWILVNESLELMYKIFSELKGIYNDIDFGSSYDVNIILEVIKLIDHEVAKVHLTAKKLIKYIGEHVIETEKFLKTVEYYVSQDVFNGVRTLFKDFNYVQTNVRDNQIATSRVINLVDDTTKKK